MPPKRRVSAPSTLRKRVRAAAPSGSVSQPITVESQQPSAPSPPSPPPASPSSNEAQLDAPPATFESQFRDSWAGANLTAPTEGSEQATVASSDVADEAVAEAINAEYEDNYDGIDWARLPRFMKPLTTSRRKPSWIYQHGYRVVLITDAEQVYFICRYCHIHKYIDAGVCGVYPAAATTAAQRHLCEKRPGHGHIQPGKLRVAVQESPLRRMLKDGVSVPQDVANELSNFSIQRFRLAAVGWLVDNNHPLSEFEKPAFLFGSLQVLPVRAVTDCQGACLFGLSLSPSRSTHQSFPTVVHHQYHPLYVSILVPLIK